MYFLKLEIQVCITAIKRFGYSFTKSDETKSLKLVRNPINAYDINAIKVMLNGKQIGWIKKQEARILSPILKVNNELSVSKWYVNTHTHGYIIATLHLNKDR